MNTDFYLWQSLIYLFSLLLLLFSVSYSRNLSLYKNNEYILLCFLIEACGFNYSLSFLSNDIKTGAQFLSHINVVLQWPSTVPGTYKDSKKATICNGIFHTYMSIFWETLTAVSAPFVEMIFFPLIELSLPGDLGYSRLIVGSSFLSVAVISIMTKAVCRSMGYYQLAGQSLPSRGSQGRTSRQQHEMGTTEEKCCFLAYSPCFLVKPRVQLSRKGVVHCGPGPPSLISN